MTSQELKNYILDNSKIEYILEDLGCHHIKFNSQKNYWSAAQPDGDNSEGVIIKETTYLNYYSYSRNIHIEEGRDLFFLVQEVKNFTFAETMKYIHKLLGLKYTFKKEDKDKSEEVKIDPLAIFKKAKSSKRYKRDVSEFNPMDEDILLDLVPMIHIDLFREGIMPWTTKKFRLCYSYRWKRTIIPHRFWSTGELIGCNARTSVENYEEFNIKKYFLTPGMPKEINLYGLFENYDAIQKAGYVVVYESEKSVLKRDSLGDSTGVAISGHSLSDEQVSILKGLNVDIIISLDTDVDIQEVRDMCERLWRGRNVYYTYDKYDILPPKSSIADAKNQVFEYMMKYKIKYDENEHREYGKGLKEKKK